MQLGSTAVISDIVANQVGELSYRAALPERSGGSKPWGESRYTTGSLPTNRLFTGQIEESSINLYWFNSRWYDATLGRFIQPDAIVPGIGEGGDPDAVGYLGASTYSLLIVDYHENQFLEQLTWENRTRLQDPNFRLPPVPTNTITFDRYAYSLNNPIRYSDPSGHCIWDLCIVEGIGFVELTIAAVATFATLEAVQPGRPEAFAQSVVDFTDELKTDLATTFTGLAEISQADKLPKTGDLPYNPPKQKGSPPYVRIHDGGFRDANGNVWRRDKSGHRGPHWDVQHPDGSHTNVDDEGKVISGK
ncbi:MAG: hypothetical protein M1281_13795 [Chloroflexi bacterium]|nr:hypothetical protein [Chloroflexota bacterium]